MTITTEAPRVVKRSVSIRRDLDRRLTERTGNRGYSAFVNRAIETQLEQDLLAEYVAVAKAEHGEVPEHIKEQVAADIEAARSRR